MFALPDRDRLLEGVDAVAGGVEGLGPVGSRGDHDHRDVADLQPTDPVEQERWRLDGASMLARAAELSGDQSYIAWQAIGGARFLGRNGERDAEVKFLERTLVVTDSPSKSGMAATTRK